ncbi:MAG: preprotein translocase subunit SecG [Bacteroidota bacterium]
MTFFIVLVILILIIAILMSVVVLLQSGKGGGLSGIAGGQTTQILGARQAPDLLEKATWALGSLFLFLSVITTLFVEDGQNQDPSAFQEAAEGAPAPTDASPLPVGPAEGVAPPAGTPEGGAPAPNAGAPASDIPAEEGE